MRGIFVDIQNELADVGREVDLLTASVELVRHAPDDATPAWRWLAIQGLASGIEKVYSGCERVMQIIADRIDGDRVGHGEGWHMSLLKRMAHPFPGIRDAAISNECFEALDRLRAFRHRARNTYGLALDAEIVITRAAETRPAFELFRTELTAFAAKGPSPPS